jgi:hypothetical protein
MTFDNTTNSQEAHRLLNALNESCREQAMNLQINQIYLQHSDGDLVKRSHALLGLFAFERLFFLRFCSQQRE